MPDITWNAVYIYFCVEDLKHHENLEYKFNTPLLHLIISLARIKDRTANELCFVSVFPSSGLVSLMSAATLKEGKYAEEYQLVTTSRA